ncbi:hypothetical protein LC605_04385 [Nostoc sp. CHAB 5836]|uniref:hypothetical protein n=1 Tax=Nostoc sp. CHAB 5836 TaxID=2780404 RepID=UPI001E3B1585|nr:hypothetical protein [Nostoc sp. CHAB 5836]MCC5614327.1 hypothetical protein [Nostoc sp. CHAB 5836]
MTIKILPQAGDKWRDTCLSLQLVEEMLQDMGESGKRLLNEYLPKAKQREDS